MKTLFKKLLSVCSILFISFALTACGSNSPSDVAKKYVEAIYAGDVDTIKDLVYLSEKDKNSPGADEAIKGKILMLVSEAKSKAEKKGGVDKVTVADTPVSSDEEFVKIKVSVKFKNGDEKNSSVSLRKTEDGWKVK